MKARILVIDDESAIRDAMRMILEYEGYECLMAATGPDGLALVERERPDLVFLDIKMPGMDGMEVLSRLRGQFESVPVVIISGHGTVTTAVEATKMGAFDFIEKPLESERVLLTVRNAVEQGRARSEIKRFQRREDDRYQMVGESAALAGLREVIGKAGPTGATVLILGESGVGKELVARAIHRASPRSRERFVQVNCAARPEELIESELFGHEKGSFTGATDKQIGKFELADRGTIFLDEIGDMSQKTQAKVLRVLQEGEVERLGSSKTAKVDVRVVAATNKDLDREIEEGRFREDLYFRLSVVPIVVPPLRDRPEDIPALAAHFARRFVAENNLRPRTLSDEALRIFQAHRWKGNVRELRNTVERLLIMSDGDVIDAAAVGAVLRTDKDTPNAVDGARPDTLRAFKETAERAFLVEKLRDNGWNISRTAEVIGTPRSNLYKKLEQYQISQDRDG